MKAKLLAMAAAACITMGGLSTIAFADTTSAPTTFDTNYQANASTEAALLQQAQATNSSDTNVVALLSAVQSIDQQVTTLYGTEQALVTAKPTIPTQNSQELQYKNQLAQLNKQRQEVLVQSNNEWKLVDLYKSHHNKALLNAAIKNHNMTEEKLLTVDGEIKGLEQKFDSRDWTNHPYDGGLTELRDTIIRLQDSAIHYTKEAIALETSDSSQIGTPTSTTAGTTTTSTTTSNVTVTSTTTGTN